jgi:ribosome-associated translation inhibitor RaiA
MQMKNAPDPVEAAAKIVVRSSNLQISDELRSNIVDRTSRLISPSSQVDRVTIDLLQDSSSDVDHRYIAKAQIEFGGPALFMSVAAQDVARAVDYLIEKIDFRMRRQRAPELARSRERIPTTTEVPRPVDEF